jgi:tellurite resistance protein
MDLMENLTYGEEGKLYVQDAILAIAVCAAELDDESSTEETDRITALALANPMFSNDAETIRKRTFRLIHSIAAGDREEALELALASLPGELKETAVSWAADVLMADGVLAPESKMFVEELARKLSVDSEITCEILEVMAIRNRTIDRGTKVELIR